MIEAFLSVGEGKMVRGLQIDRDGGGMQVREVAEEVTADPFAHLAVEDVGDIRHCEVDFIGEYEG